MRMRILAAASIAAGVALVSGLVLRTEPAADTTASVIPWECQARLDQGTDDLPPEALEWLLLCVRAFQPTATPSSPAVPTTATPTSTSPSTSPTPTELPSSSPSTPTPTASTSASPSTPTPSPSGTTPSPSTSSGPTLTYPTRSVTGPPDDWTPTLTVLRTLVITQPGTYQNLRVNGSVEIRTPGVVLRNAHIAGGRVWNEYAGRCYPATLQNVAITPPQGAIYTENNSDGALGPGGITADRVEIHNRIEGVRVGGKQWPGCDQPTTITNSWIGIKPDPAWCSRSDVDWHGDGVQGYGAAHLIIRNTVIRYEGGGCGTTAPFFVPSGQGNTSVDIDRLLVHSDGFAGYAFRLGVPGAVRNLDIVQYTPGRGYREIDVLCRAVTAWSAQVVTAAGSPVRALPCNTQGGS